MTPPSRIKKWFIRTVFALICLITFGALFVAEEDWRGSREWASYKREIEAKGEGFDPARFNSTPVPDDQNLAALPFFTRQEPVHLPEDVKLPKRVGWHIDAAVRLTDITNWAEAYGNPAGDSAQAATNVLAALDRQEPLIAELQDARHRPYCRFNVDYENWMSNTNVQAATFAQLSQVKAFVRVLTLRVEAELLCGKSDQALDDVQAMLRAIDGLRQEPLWISQLVGYACFEVALQPVAEGLATHRWNESQLQALQNGLAQMDFLAAGRNTFVGERDICANAYFKTARMGLRGWTRLEQVNYNRAIEQTLLPRIDVTARRIDPAVSEACEQALKKEMEHAFLRHRIMLSMIAASDAKVCERTAAAQTRADELRVACALERYRLVENHFPENLQMLMPRFAASLPNDVISGQPLNYELKKDGNYTLSSVGWNKAGHGGAVAAGSKGGQHERDWTFQP